MHKIFFSLLLLAWLLMACSGKKNAPTNPEAASTPSDTTALAQTVADSPAPLPPLETGEFTLDDEKVFGKDIELTGTNIVEPDTFIFKPTGFEMELGEDCRVVRAVYEDLDEEQLRTVFLICVDSARRSVGRLRV